MTLPPFPPGPVSAADLRDVVELATHAPSLHNSQPWRFRLADDVIEVRADPTRAVPVVDPSGRQRVISCGGAVFYARLGLEARGREAAVELAPDPADPDFLARIRVGEPTEVRPEIQRLYDAIDLRRTHREAFEPRPVDRALHGELRRAAESEGAWAQIVDSPDDQLRLTVLLAEADAAEAADPAYREELAEWRRRGDAGDEGIPESAVPADVRGRASDYVLRDFRAGTGGAPAGDLPPPAEHPLIVVLVTPGDTVLDWVAGGQALAHLLLRAAADGVNASPLNQVVDLPGHRAMLRHELRLMGSPQMVLRMGYGSGGTTSPTPRRPVADVLE